MPFRLLLLVFLSTSVSEESFTKWSLSKAVNILNDSPWARQETFTRVVGGVGSGVSGEKEIYNTFYVRFLSARPIREAYTRIQQIQMGYDKWGIEERREFDRSRQSDLELDVTKWIVVVLSFRSNDPNEESRVRRFLQTQTVETLRSQVFLSTQRFSQIAMAAYFPPREEIVGAKFVFPRNIEGRLAVSQQSKTITFEFLDLPGANPNLRATFAVKEMVKGGELIL